jgi:hypothetical protein
MNHLSDLLGPTLKSVPPSQTVNLHFPLQPHDIKETTRFKPHGSSIILTLIKQELI